jgi:hypothetical protein
MSLLDSVPRDIIHRMMSTFLLMRDIRAMTSTSTTSYHTWHSLEDQLPPGINSCVCRQLSCPNRHYIYHNIDPFIPYLFMSLPNYVCLMAINIVVSTCAAPLYLRPMYHILIGRSHADLGEAIVSYQRLESIICAFTRTSSVVCRCVRHLEYEMFRTRCLCTLKRRYAESLPKTDGCLVCVVQSCSTRDRSSMMPLSFIGFFFGVLLSVVLVTTVIWWSAVASLLKTYRH